MPVAFGVDDLGNSPRLDESGTRMPNEEVGGDRSEIVPAERVAQRDIDAPQWESLTIFFWDEEPDHPSAWPTDESDDWPPDP